MCRALEHPQGEQEGEDEEPAEEEEAAAAGRAGSGFCGAEAASAAARARAVRGLAARCLVGLARRLHQLHLGTQRPVWLEARLRELGARGCDRLMRLLSENEALAVELLLDALPPPHSPAPPLPGCLGRPHSLFAAFLRSLVAPAALEPPEDRGEEEAGEHGDYLLVDLLTSSETRLLEYTLHYAARAAIDLQNDQSAASGMDDEAERAALVGNVARLARLERLLARLEARGALPFRVGPLRRRLRAAAVLLTAAAPTAPAPAPEAPT
jgi:hypothetical protein